MRPWASKLVELPTMTSESMSTAAQSSDSSVVTCTRSPGRDASVTTPTGVVGGRASRRIDRAASSCQVRRLDRGLYSATARSLTAIARSRFSMTAHGVSRSDRLTYA